MQVFSPATVGTEGSPLCNPRPAVAAVSARWKFWEDPLPETLFVSHRAAFAAALSAPRRSTRLRDAEYADDCLFLEWNSTVSVNDQRHGL
jgi:hypothetical protein